MNPYHAPLAQLHDTLAHNFEAAAVSAVLTVMATAYSTGFVRGPANSEYDYCARQPDATFGPENLIARKFASLFAAKLGRSQ
jgi:hypothetical protein